MRLFNSAWTAKYLLVHPPRTVIWFHSELINDTVKFSFDFSLTIVIFNHQVIIFDTMT